MRTWYGIDFFKIVAAILIVYMHTYNGDLGSSGDWVKEVLSTACVPFFFIASGFFLRRGMDRYSGSPEADNQEREWFKNYLVRLVKMYLSWTILTLPVAVMVVNRAHPEYGVLMKLIYHVRLLLLTGSLGIYWFLLALILCALIIRWCCKKGLLKPLMIVSVILFLWGCVYNSPYNNHQPWFEVLHVVFGSERNFLNMGLFYMLLGFVFPFKAVSSFRIKWLFLLLFLVAIYIRTVEARAAGTNFAQAIIAGTAFLVAVSYDFRWFSSVSLEMRRLSIALYLIHFPLILLFDFYLAKGTLLDFPFTLLSSVALYYLIIAVVPKCSALLFGYARRNLILNT